MPQNDPNVSTVSEVLADKIVRFFVPLYTDGADKINISGEYDEKESTRIRLLMQLLRSPRGEKSSEVKC